MMADGLAVAFKSFDTDNDGDWLMQSYDTSSQSCTTRIHR